jgi:hypothetical protein
VYGGFIYRGSTRHSVQHFILKTLCMEALRIKTLYIEALCIEALRIEALYIEALYDALHNALH